jgi:hypothetical protein
LRQEGDGVAARDMRPAPLQLAVNSWTEPSALGKFLLRHAGRATLLAHVLAKTCGHAVLHYATTRGKYILVRSTL